MVPKAGSRLDRAALRKRLLERLPPYMVPAFLEEVAALPMTISGKIDRASLPEPRSALGGADREIAAARDEAERAVVKCWRAVLRREDVGIRDDFFHDLDGHSLLAAQAVSELRKTPDFERISVADLYGNPTPEALARLARRRDCAPPARERAFHEASSKSYAACAAGQGLGVMLLAGLYAWQWLGPFLTYGYLVVEDWPIHRALWAALLVYLVVTPASLGASIGLKWLLLGRVRPGNYPLWGWFYWRFWFVRAVVRAVPVQYLAGTPFLNLYYRLMGARIGKDVFLGGHGLSTFDVLKIGEGSSVGADTSIDGACVEAGELRIAPVAIGRNCWVGNRCALGAGSVMEDGAGLDDLSLLEDGGRVPSGELWRGSPARPAGLLPPESRRRPWSPASAAAQLAGVFVFPLVVLVAVFPGLMAITHIGHMQEGYAFLLFSPIVALSFVALLCLEIWAAKWLLLGRIREGRYPVDGSFYARLWFFDQLMDLSLEVIGTFYTTLYLRPWLRALGARIGPRCEISTIRLVHPDLLSAGAECFLADDVMVGTPRVRAGWITIGRARLGERTFVGNSAVLCEDAVLGNDVLIGVLSMAPDVSAPDGSSWFGSPPIHMPSRQRHEGFSYAQTYRPPARLVALRLAVEFFRVLLPSMIFVILASLIITATDLLQDYIGLGAWLLLLPALYMAAGVLAMAATWLLKTVLVGRYREDEKPLWCGFIWRTELVTGVYENLCVLFFADLLRGTPFLGWVLRAFGAKIGRRCYIDTTWLTEFDLVEIGAEAALNDNANIQTHLFEDRVMKTGRVRLQSRCSVGAGSTVLYGTTMGEGSSLGELSLLMKGESLPAGTRWRGIPAS